MPRAPRPRRRAPSARPAAVTLTKAGVAALLAALAVACVDVTPPTTAPRPRADLSCETSAPCGTPDAPAPPGTRQVRIASARGPNAEGSFTTLRGERTITVHTDVVPVELARLLSWSIEVMPEDDAYLGFPRQAPTDATTVAVDVLTADVSRWRLPHGAPLSARALALRVATWLPQQAGQPTAADSTVVRQREVDVLRQEYADFGIPVPAASEARTPGDVAGATRFTWAQLNQGDYGVAVLTPRLLSKLDEMDALSGRSLVPTSVFRNPAHHRFHISVSGGFATAQQSQHQYGTAVDVSTGRSLAKWNQLYALAKKLGACAEPLHIATVNHVHADWRPSAPICPPGW